MGETPPPGWGRASTSKQVAGLEGRVAAQVGRIRRLAGVRDDAPDMRAVCQRVAEARVRVDGEIVAEIGAGLVVLLGMARGDTDAASDRLATKIGALRVFEDDEGKFDRSILDVNGSALVVSQFTLLADSRRQKGTRLDFSQAAPRAEAELLYDAFCEALREAGVPVQTAAVHRRRYLVFSSA